MPPIIQDFGKIINSRISNTLLVYFGLIFCLSSGFIIGRMTTLKIEKPEVTISSDSENYLQQSGYDSSSGENISGTSSEEENSKDFSNNSAYKNNSNYSGAKASVDKSQIFASKKGKYFYYKGCGGNTITKKNLVYYKSEAQAISAGKIIYSKCK